ncbi:hypothetical protein RAB70_13510 [Xanthomonas sontii]|uniref:hypothetical protein n=1 Tax=Xanthomonas sontii TaxID=2650745 RepID=UPI00147842FD|nr:hypothetical protein [Xanthomonas sontii]MDQ7759402.1 hypothetical protein [Xanthomonas sontii]UZK07092.1 hypothetical protein CJ027_010255 [Xanthomonas sontii]
MRNNVVLVVVGLVVMVAVQFPYNALTAWQAGIGIPSRKVFSVLKETGTLLG